jgi:2-keto-4-pentenoate hydratase/2-oxohepta-3-ene-1,7-dioic acid hydratase in catechol pathway
VKLFRFGRPGRERPGLLADDGTLRDVSALSDDYGEQFFESGGMERLRGLAPAQIDTCPIVPAAERLGPCVQRPCKIVCVGRNYRAHAAETGAEPPGEPLLFMKAPTAFSGPFDDVVLPPGAAKADWEVELGVVIGKEARNVTRESALGYVAGYTLVNDYTERGFQRDRGGQWTKGKSADSFCPVGPYLVTADSLVPAGVELRLSVNGVERQRAPTSDMIFDVPTLIAYVSDFMTLLPGDLLSTGTPEGVGFGSKPPIFLSPGDLVRYEGTGLGSAAQRVVAWPGAE